MKQSTTLWLLAFLLTCATAYYQRATGPTYPLSGKVIVNGKELFYRLDRSHGGESNAVIKIETNDSSIHGAAEWKKYRTNDDWTQAPMRYSDGFLSAELPHQPPAGKLLYRIVFHHDERAVFVPQDEPVIIRFKGDVPLSILLPHIIAMFGAMLLSARTGLEYFSREQKFKKLVFWTIGFLFVGGLILGPIVQLFAFDALWTGWPMGTDLTDNKTAFALLVWVVTGIALRKPHHSKVWVLWAAIITLVVYLIPHSLLGSELDYDAKKPAIKNYNGK
jgi:hypothetical protein